MDVGGLGGTVVDPQRRIDVDHLSPSSHIPSSSLRRNTIWSVAGNVGYLATQWGALVLLAKTQGAQSVGVYSLGLAITAPLMVFASMELRSLQATDAKERFSFSDYLGLRLLTVGFAVLLLIVVCLLAPVPRETQWVIGTIGVIKALDLISDTSFGLYQRRERLDLTCVARVANGLLSLFGFAFVVIVFDSMLGGLVVSAVISLIMLLTFNVYWVWRLRNDAPTMRPFRLRANDVLASITPRWDGTKLRDLAVMGLPLAIAVSLNSFGSSLPRFVVQHELGESALGIFSALAYSMLVGSTLVDALGNATSPRLATYFAEGQHAEFRSLLLKLIVMSIVGTIAMIVVVQLFGERLIALAYTSSFARENTLLLLLTLATGIQFLGSILGFGMIVVRNLKARALIQTVALILGILLYFPLAQRYGLNGIGIAAIMIAIVQSGMAAIVTKQYMSRQKALTTAAG